MTVAEWVQKQLDNGRLIHNLRSTGRIPEKNAGVLVSQASKERILTGRYVDSGEARQALKQAGWADACIDYLFFRDPADGNKTVTEKT